LSLRPAVLFILVAMKRISGYTHIFIQTFSGTAVAANNEPLKGWICFALLTIFVLMTLTGFFRTTFTSPGRVSTEW